MPKTKPINYEKIYEAVHHVNFNIRDVFFYCGDNTSLENIDDGIESEVSFGCS